MPWQATDVVKHNRKAAKSKVKRRVWVKVANTWLKSHAGDEAGAIKVANHAVKNIAASLNECIKVFSDAVNIETVKAWTNEQKEHADLATKYNKEAQHHDKEMRKAKDAAKQASTSKEKLLYNKLAKHHENLRGVANTKAQTHKMKSVSSAIGIADGNGTSVDGTIQTNWDYQVGLNNPKLLVPVHIVRKSKEKRVRKLVRYNKIKPTIAAFASRAAQLERRVNSLQDQIIGEARIAYPNGPQSVVVNFMANHPRQAELMRLKSKHIMELNHQFKTQTLLNLVSRIKG